MPDVAPTDPYDYASPAETADRRRAAADGVPARPRRLEAACGAAAVVPQAGGGDRGGRARGPGGAGGRGAVRDASGDTPPTPASHDRVRHDHSHRRHRECRACAAPGDEAPPPRTVTDQAPPPVVTVTQDRRRPRRPARRRRHRRRSRRPSPHPNRRPSRRPATRRRCDSDAALADHPGSAVRSRTPIARSTATRALGVRQPLGCPP